MEWDEICKNSGTTAVPTDAVEGTYNATLEVPEQKRVGRNGKPYSLWTFAVQGIGGGNLAYYCGHHRAAELERVRKLVEDSAGCRVVVKRKPGVGLIVSEVLSRRIAVENPPPD